MSSDVSKTVQGIASQASEGKGKIKELEETLAFMSRKFGKALKKT